MPEVEDLLKLSTKDLVQLLQESRVKVQEYIEKLPSITSGGEAVKAIVLEDLDESIIRELDSSMKTVDVRVHAFNMFLTLNDFDVSELEVDPEEGSVVMASDIGGVELPPRFHLTR